MRRATLTASLPYCTALSSSLPLLNFPQNCFFFSSPALAIQKPECKKLTVDLQPGLLTVPVIWQSTQRRLVVEEDRASDTLVNLCVEVWSLIIHFEIFFFFVFKNKYTCSFFIVKWSATPNKAQNIFSSTVVQFWGTFSASLYFHSMYVSVIQLKKHTDANNQINAEYLILNTECMVCLLLRVLLIIIWASEPNC